MAPEPSRCPDKGLRRKSIQGVRCKPAVEVIDQAIFVSVADHPQPGDGPVITSARHCPAGIS